MSGACALCAGAENYYRDTERREIKLVSVCDNFSDVAKMIRLVVPNSRRGNGISFGFQRCLNLI